MSFDFNEALDTKANEVEKPAVLPQGNYIWRVSKPPVASTSKSGEWSILEFPLACVSADDDVDPDDLEAFGPLDSTYNRVTFMAPTDPTKEQDVKKTLYRLTKFLQETLRVDCEDDATVKEMLANAMNCQLYATASWTPSDDGTDTYVNLKNLAPLD
jgi:hypothetical protein